MMACDLHLLHVPAVTTVWNVPSCTCRDRFCDVSRLINYRHVEIKKPKISTPSHPLSQDFFGLKIITNARQILVEIYISQFRSDCPVRFFHHLKLFFFIRARISDRRCQWMRSERHWTVKSVNKGKVQRRSLRVFKVLHNNTMSSSWTLSTMSSSRTLSIHQAH